MSRMTNYAENQLIDWFFRAQAHGLPLGWYFALGSAASDSSFTELSGTGYARQPVARSLTAFAGTQGDLSVLASSGVTHSTSNNDTVDWGTAASNWGDANYVGFFDDASAGNCWFYLPLQNAVTVNDTDSFSVAPTEVALTLGLTGGMTDYLANKLIDFIFRGQTYTPPSTIYQMLFNFTPSNAGGGTEVSGGSYARVGMSRALSTWSGTQAPGSTSASTGTGGRTSNNSPVTFATPTADWSTIEAAGMSNASSGGNLLMWRPLSTPKPVSLGSVAPSYAADAIGVTFQ